MIPIFMYHQVAELPGELDPLGLAMPPTQFEQQMCYLAHKGFRCLTLAEAVAYLRNDGRAPERSFVLTFDDGYQDVHSMAYPILEKFGFTATVFLVTNRLGLLSDWWGKDGHCAEHLMSWEEARDLAKHGFLLGSHTLSHPFLNKLDSQAAFREIRNSKLVLEERLDLRIDFFSFPYSDASTRNEGLVQAAGYTAACAGDGGTWGLFHLWRVPCLRSDSLFSFALKANGWYGRRTALRESTTGLLLRRYVRMIRRRLRTSRPPSGDRGIREIYGGSDRES